MEQLSRDDLIRQESEVRAVRAAAPRLSRVEVATGMAFDAQIRACHAALAQAERAQQVYVAHLRDVHEAEESTWMLRSWSEGFVFVGGVVDADGVEEEEAHG